MNGLRLRGAIVLGIGLLFLPLAACGGGGGGGGGGGTITPDTRVPWLLDAT